MTDQNLIALVAEGSAEEAILDVLLDHQLLKFDREQLLEEEIIRTRSAKSFQTRHLDHGLEPGQQVSIYRILDSKREAFKLSKAYQSKVAEVREIYTTPEIEMLFIVYFDEYKQFKKSGQKPSSYVKATHGKLLGNVKAYDVVYQFWTQRPSELIASIRHFAQLSKLPIESTLVALLK